MPTRSPKKPAESVFADTNLFLRHLTNDVPDQADAVEALLRKAAAGELMLVSNSMVVAEIVWTLESFYHLPRTEIRDKVVAILNSPGLEIADGDLLLQATADYVDQNVDFIDAYNRAWAIQQGVKKVYTFDQRHFSRLAGITVVVPGEEPEEEEEKGTDSVH